MNIYKIERTDTWGYDDYDSAVVVAATAKDARETYPNGIGGLYSYCSGQGCFVTEQAKPFSWGGWPQTTDLVKATLIGTAADGMEPGVVCASFNAG